MITRDLIITVNDDVSVLNEPITLYRGDRGITLNCKIVQYKFQFMRTTDGNVITGTNIINARVLVHKPDGNGCFEVPLAKVKDDIVVIPISADWLDEISEIGTYKLQIQLYGEDPVQQRVTIPPIEFTVRDTLCDINENFSDIAGYALTDTSAIKLKGDSYNADLNNGYTPTIWVTGDIITSTSLNKMEEAIEYSVDKVNSINGVEDNDKVDYMGNHHTSLKNKADADVEYILGEVNTAHYEGQRITATDTIEKQVKQAELKGCTLVNIKPNKHLSIWGRGSYDSSTGVCTLDKTNTGIRFNQSLLKTSTKYLVVFDIIEPPTFVVENDSPIKLALGNQNTGYVNIHKSELKVGVLKKITTTPNEIIGTIDVCVRGEFATPMKLRFMIIEYQDGMENWDIPYFEGMVSVTNPTVTMTGKNLFNKDTSFGGWVEDETGIITKRGNIGAGDNIVSDYIKITPTEAYVMDTPVYQWYYTENKEYIKKSVSIGVNIIPPIDAGYVVLAKSISNQNSEFYSILNSMQLEQGSVATSYEPFKSNILSTPQDLELRGIGDVQDTLNLVTGEYTKVIYEYTFTGDEDWKIHGGNTGGYTYFMFSSDRLPIKPNGLTNIPISCDRLPIVTHNDFDSGLKSVGINLSYFFRLNFKDCNSNDGATVEDLKAYLKANPTTVQYLIGKSIKTVDLKGQKVYSYESTTYYTTSAAENHPVPTLSIDVPTNLPALVSRQRATIQALTVENQEIKAVNEAQDTDIALNQEAINFMLFQSTSMMLSEQTKGINPMSTYLANQIIKGKLSYDLVVEKYEDFKEEIDMILMDKCGQELDKLNK